MKASMQDVPLSITHLFDRAEQYFGHKGIVTATAAGREWRPYAEWAERTRRLGGVLDSLGISPDGRVATFAWNTARHLELYFAAPCTGRVLHTLNIRLFPEQLTYIVNHADDEVIFVDRSLLALLAPLLKTFERVEHLVLMDDGKGDIPSDLNGHELLDYEELLAAADAGRVPDRRREPGRQHVLHERHDGQPEGRRVQPPQHVPPHDGGVDGRLGRGQGVRSRSCRSCRCSTPTPGASPTPASPPVPTW